KVVAGISDLITMDSEKLEILENGVLELLLLLGGVGIIESDDELALVLLRKVLVQQRGLCVTNVKISAAILGQQPPSYGDYFWNSRWLGREPGHNTLIGIEQANLKVRLLALGLLLVGQLR